jgi:hypothetical protein
MENNFSNGLLPFGTTNIKNQDSPLSKNFTIGFINYITIQQTTLRNKAVTISDSHK